MLNSPRKSKTFGDGIGADRVIDVVGLKRTMAARIRLRCGAVGAWSSWGIHRKRIQLSGKELAQNEKEVIGTRAGRRDDLLPLPPAVRGLDSLRSIVGLSSIPSIRLTKR